MKKIFVLLLACALAIGLSACTGQKPYKEASGQPTAKTPTETASPSPSESPAPSGTPTPTESATPTEAPTTETPTPTESATPSETPTDSVMAPADYIGWDQMVANPPLGLRTTINNRADTLGWSWADVEGWAAQQSPSGNYWDVRVILVFGQDDMSAADAREAAGIDVNVPVVRVKTCKNVVNADGCPVDGVEVILAPINGDGVPQLGTGIVLQDDYPIVAGLTGKQIK